MSFGYAHIYKGNALVLDRRGVYWLEAPPRMRTAGHPSMIRVPVDFVGTGAIIRRLDQVFKRLFETHLREWVPRSEMTQELLDAWPDWIGLWEPDGGWVRYNGLRNMTVVKYRGTHWRPATSTDEHTDCLG